jgi:hypothetical protein
MPATTELALRVAETVRPPARFTDPTVKKIREVLDG